MSETPRRIIVQSHARERAHERIPDARVGHGDMTPVIFAQVQNAFRDGLISKNKPAWVIQPNHRRGKAPKCAGVQRFAWTPERTHCFVLQRGRSPDGDGSCWFVITVLPREEVGAAA